MPKITEAQTILELLGMPSQQRNEMAALTLLALCGLKPDDPWSSAKRKSLTIKKGIMAFIRTEHGKNYAENTRESIRRQVLHQFVQAHVAEHNPDMPFLATNSSKNHYALSEAVLSVLQRFGTAEWTDALQEFKASYRTLQAIYDAARERAGIPLTLPDGMDVVLSPGDHNRLQAQVVSLFAPQFASGAQLLYLGDTADKDLFVASDVFRDLKIAVSDHDKMPDIVLYLPEKQWVYLVEVVTSHGPMTPKRLIELHSMLQNCPAKPIFVTAFATFSDFRKYMRDIAWETEVWIAEVPDHLIHFNGDRFLGPRN